MLASWLAGRERVGDSRTTRAEAERERKREREKHRQQQKTGSTTLGFSDEDSWGKPVEVILARGLTTLFYFCFPSLLDKQNF